MEHQTAQEVSKVMEIAGAATAAGSGISGWISTNHELIWFSGIVVGSVVGVVGLLINWYYKYKDDKRKERLAKRR